MIYNLLGSFNHCKENQSSKPTATISAIATEETEVRHVVQEHAASRMSRYAVIAFIVASIFCFVTCPERSLSLP
jgi:hypothetical protein